jgi:protein ImuB
MALWFAMCLPALPLQLAARALDARTHAGPLAIVDGPAQRPAVAFCNQAAYDAGIVPGQKLAAAQALAHDLIAAERKREREDDALHELACWAYQFSAQIVIKENGLLLESGGSERLFGGRDKTHRLIGAGLRRLGYDASCGYAATPRAAWIIAVARAHRVTAHDAPDGAGLRAALAPLPLQTLGWDETTLTTLHALGQQTIGDVLNLPRAAFGKRFGATLLDDLDRALDAQPDPQPLFAPPERFEAHLELPADVVDAAQLMFPAQRLLRSLEGFLRGRGAGTTALRFSARHSPRRTLPLPPTQIDVALAAPERDAERLAKLLAERLARVRLPEPAIALSLLVEQLLPFKAANATWLPPAPGDTAYGAQDDWLQLAETLHARFGSERVFQLQALDDHRPEHAYRIVPLAVDVSERKSLPLAATAQRPLLLLTDAQPLACREETPEYGGPLALLAGPERLESGWWDHARTAARSVARDYFVARNPAGQTLWVYRELAAPRGWYLHGFFA